MCTLKLKSNLNRKEEKIHKILLESDVVVPQPLGGDLVLLADLDAGLLQDLEPRMGQSLADAHPFLWFVDLF